MPKQITVEVNAMAYDTSAAENSRTLQPLTVEQEVTVTAGSHAQALVEGLAAAVNMVAARVGQPEQAMLPEPIELVLDELHASVAGAPRVSSNTVAVGVGDLNRWASLLADAFTGHPVDGCTCERGVCQHHVKPLTEVVDTSGNASPSESMRGFARALGGTC